jgi:hypothetical protein
MTMTIRASTRPHCLVTEYMQITRTHTLARMQKLRLDRHSAHGGRMQALDPPGCTSPSESRKRETNISHATHIDACAKPLCRCLKAHCTSTAAAMQGMSIRGPTANGSGCHEALNMSLRPSIPSPNANGQVHVHDRLLSAGFCFFTGHLGCSFDRLSAVSPGF